MEDRECVDWAEEDEGGVELEAAKADETLDRPEDKPTDLRLPAEAGSGEPFEAALVPPEDDDAAVDWIKSESSVLGKPTDQSTSNTVER